jgi:hypothetical protein
MKVIISFTTIPSRIGEIKPMIDSICNQTFKPNSILLWLPKTYKRSKSELKIPDFIKRSNIRIELCKDVGPFTKLYYILKQEYNNKETIIVTADDDVYYPPKWLEGLIKQSKKTPNKAIGYRGRILENKLDYKSGQLMFGAPTRKPLNVDVITGTWGALYKPKFFSEFIFNNEMLSSNFMVDDIWITGNLAQNGIERIIIKNRGVKSIQEIHNIDPLWSINKESDNNNKMLQFFKGII